MIDGDAYPSPLVEGRILDGTADAPARLLTRADKRGTIQAAYRSYVECGGFPMGNERNSHRIAIVLFAVAVIIAILAATVTTLERDDTKTASNETPPGTTGLAKPHPPLDRAPGQPLRN